MAEMSVEEFENKCMDIIEQITSIDIKQTRQGAIKVAEKMLEKAKTTGKKKIIDIYEEKEAGKPAFIFEVTMQNHGGYATKYKNFEQNLVNLLKYSLPKIIEYSIISCIFVPYSIDFILSLFISSLFFLENCIF